MSGSCGTSDNLTYQWYSARGFGSVMQDLLKDYLFYSNSLEVFVQKGFIIEKSIFNDNNFIVMDIETGIVRDIKTVNNFCGAYSNAQRYQPILAYFYRQDHPVGEMVSNSVRFWWDGTGQVLISNRDDSVGADDELIIVGPGGTIVRYYGNIGVRSGPIDITSILEPGANTIQVIVQDLFASMIGCTSLSLVQTATVINYDQQTHFDPRGLAINLIYSVPFIPKEMKEGKHWNDEPIFLGGLSITAGYFCFFIPPLVDYGPELVMHGSEMIAEHWNEPTWI